jgi:hypothetical protein
VDQTLSQQSQDELVRQAALEYLGYGWAVFPLSTANSRLTGAHRTLSGKLPTKPRYFIAPITRADKLTTAVFRGFGIGIATGRRSGIVVLDVDGETGLNSAVKLNLPPTRTVKTRNGLHLYYAYPPDSGRVPSSPASLAEGIDVKGDNGFVNAPPSLHPDGGHYQWVDPDAPIAPLPADLLSSIYSLPHRKLWKLLRKYIFRKYIRHPINAITGK